MKIAVVFTGGTIGSKTHGAEISLGKAPYTLLDGAGSPDVIFDCREPYTVLSEEMTAEHLSMLSDAVKDAQKSGADGIIVTHGTDSLVYSAAFLGYVFSDSKVPIVLVSSGYPLDDERANGRQNFAAAVELVRSGEKGVFAVWQADGVCKVHQGVRLVRQMPYDDLLTSITGGEIHGEPFPVPEQLDGFGRVLAMPVLPSMFYPDLNGVSAVLLTAYHSGTLCADGRFADFMSRAQALGVPVFIAGAGGRTADYETAKKYKSLGAVPLPMASPDTMYVKLCLAVSQERTAEGIKRLMLTPFAGDFAE